MKLEKLDLPTLQSLGRLVQWAIQCTFTDLLYDKAQRTALQSVILKIAKAIRQKKKSRTLQLTEIEAFFMRETGQTALELHPGWADTLVFEKYFKPYLNPQP